MAEQVQKKSYAQVELLAETTVDATTTGTAGTSIRPYVDASGYMFILDVTNAATAAGDTLDVYIQTAFHYDMNTNNTARWFNICRFTQILGNGTNTLSYANKVCAYEPMGTEIELEHATPTYNTLVEGEVVHLMGDLVRVFYVMNDAGAGSFTFSVLMIAM